MTKRFGLKFLIVLLIAGLFSCKSNIICPAFQSTYILDDSLRLMAFSPFDADEQPKGGQMVRKNKNGIIDHDPYWRKNYELRVVRMENQFLPPPVDSAQFFQEELTTPDSLMVADSALMDKPATAPAVQKEVKYIRKYDPKDGFNQEQEFYNKHFGELFIQKNPPKQPTPAVVPQAIDSATNDQQEKKGLFNRRNREPVEEPLPDASDELPLDPADSTGN